MLLFIIFYNVIETFEYVLTILVIKPGQTFCPQLLSTCFAIFYNLYTLLVTICIELSAGTLVSDKSYRKIRNSLRASSSFIVIEARSDSSQATNALGSSLACCSRVTSLAPPNRELDRLQARPERIASPVWQWNFSHQEWIVE